MYITLQIKVWSLPHLKSRGWYLDCSKGFYLAEKEAAIDA
jgi:hypothetical protein